MLSFGSAQQRDVESLQNWLRGTGGLAREETEYLLYRELMCLAPAADSAVMQLETWVEDKLIRFYRGFRKVRDKYEYRIRLTKQIGLFSRVLKRSECVHLFGAFNLTNC